MNQSLTPDHTFLLVDFDDPPTRLETGDNRDMESTQEVVRIPFWYDEPLGQMQRHIKTQTLLRHIGRLNHM